MYIRVHTCTYVYILLMYLYYREVDGRDGCGGGDDRPAVAFVCARARVCGKNKRRGTLPEATNATSLLVPCLTGGQTERRICLGQRTTLSVPCLTGGRAGRCSTACCGSLSCAAASAFFLATRTAADAAAHLDRRDVGRQHCQAPEREGQGEQMGRVDFGLCR